MIRIKFFLYIFVGIFLLSLIFHSCEDSYNDYDGDESCDTIEPFNGYLKLKLTINRENQKIPIIVYRGKIDDNEVVYIDTISSSYFEISMPVDEFYSVKAKYISNDKTIYAIDGNKIKKSSYTYGDSTCWNVRDAKIDVRLNY
jgi:hypothetical protein